MRITFGKILSLVLAASCAIVAVNHAGVAGLKWSAGLLLPLIFIWFPEEIGNLTGYFRTGYVNVQTPAPMISFTGWFLLVGLPALFYLVGKFAT